MALASSFNPKGYKARLLNPYVLELYYERPLATHYIQFDFFTRTMTVSDGKSIQGVKAFEELGSDLVRDMKYGLEKLGGTVNIGPNDRDRLFDATAREMTAPPANTDSSDDVPNTKRPGPLERTADGRFVWRT